VFSLSWSLSSSKVSILPWVVVVVLLRSLPSLPQKHQRLMEHRGRYLCPCHSNRARRCLPSCRPKVCPELAVEQDLVPGRYTIAECQPKIQTLGLGRSLHHGCPNPQSRHRPRTIGLVSRHQPRINPIIHPRARLVPFKPPSMFIVSRLISYFYLFGS
jgi:hypothetical protein